ncbi:response regulator of the LytR/AlgR family [Eubacterium sp. CAG:248]|nr:response regulator of the LytR/AlgR family [Eubacterium sp. CAG:248]
MKIAICDDEREFLENVGLAIETYLNEKGLEYNIDLYNSGKAIMELRENIVSYDVVFLDINMPEVSGLEVAEWIRTYSDNVNIVFITAIISYAI